ncbi:MAG: RrF2 family transcriptional regulator [Candidatus Kapaibacterium sp.]
MLRLSKKVEYAILALQYMGARKGELVSAKEMSEFLNISFEFLSKTLQALMKGGLVKSQQGIKGGYQMTRDPSEISIADVIRSVDGKTGLVECISKDKEGCDRVEDCTIRTPILKMHKRVSQIFAKTTIADLLVEEEFEINK